MTAIRAKVSESGRISLPAEIRKSVGLDHGGDVVVTLEGNEIRIRTIDEAVAQAQALTKQLIADKPGSSVDDFLAERRREAAKE